MISIGLRRGLGRQEALEPQRNAKGANDAKDASVGDAYCQAEPDLRDYLLPKANVGIANSMAPRWREVSALPSGQQETLDF